MTPVPVPPMHYGIRYIQISRARMWLMLMQARR